MANDLKIDISDIMGSTAKKIAKAASRTNEWVQKKVNTAIIEAYSDYTIGGSERFAADHPYLEPDRNYIGYYAGYSPKVYDRTYELTNLLEPINKYGFSRAGNSFEMSISYGLNWDSSRMHHEETMYQKGNKCNRTLSDEEEDLIANNFLSGVHKRAESWDNGVIYDELEEKIDKMSGVASDENTDEILNYFKNALWTEGLIAYGKG